MNRPTAYLLLLALLALAACTSPDAPDTEKTTTPLFEQLDATATGIDFTNTLSTDANFDVFRYRNYYNGGGVGIGDLDNDGLPDVYLTANSAPNKLYLNRGDFKFEDVTQTAGVGGTSAWATGVAMADVNADGYLDIYVCASGDLKGNNRRNELFINQQDGTFKEEAAAYGLDDPGFSTHAVFFDYDADGDLDCYILNNSFQPVSTLGYRNTRDIRDELGGDKLMRNDGGTFTDVSEEAGIYGSVIGFGLGVTVGDANDDNRPDIYISNDFFERDYLYINQGDGTFSEELTDRMGHTSLASMGADMADLDNDGAPEIFVTDMLPSDDRRLKMTSTFEDWDTYQMKQRNKFYHQYMRNMLHLNSGDGSYSEVGQLAGVHASDWSWGALIADFDLDSYKDIYVCNGIYKDVTDQDFMNYLASDSKIRAAQMGRKVDFQEFIDKMPSERIPNALFARPDGGMQFENVAEEWGLDEPSHSNGAAYADLDGDGDLDLVVNNVNQPAFVYRNRADERGGRSLRLRFEGAGGNTFGLGAEVRVECGDQVIAYQHMPMRGFQSSMDYTAVLGVGSCSEGVQVRVEWPDGRVQQLDDVTSKELTLRYADAQPAGEMAAAKTTNSTLRFTRRDNLLDYTHTENRFVDFDRDRMVYNMLSTEGPALAVGDLDGDGLQDLYLGGAKGSAGAVYRQSASGFVRMEMPALQADAASEDVAATFFDMDGDSDLDLYVVSGGSEYDESNPELADRLYRNDGGTLVATERLLPNIQRIGSTVQAADVDGDGDIDLFVGVRAVPYAYGKAPDSYLLINDGKGRFEDRTRLQAAALKGLGLVTDATFSDYDGDGDDDLIVVGEWMPVTVLPNDGKGNFGAAKELPGLSNSNGWYERIQAADLDGDGDMDYVVGNLGLNTKFKASPEAPISLYTADFDKNGASEQIYTQVLDGREMPFILRHDLVKQLPMVSKRFTDYKSYSTASLDDIFTPEELAAANIQRAYEFRSGILTNEGGRFTFTPLPMAAQVAPAYGVMVHDLDGDGVPEIVVAGNFYATKPEVGRYDAGRGVVLRRTADGSYESLTDRATGLLLDGQVRDMAIVPGAGDRMRLVVVNNDAKAVVYE